MATEELKRERNTTWWGWLTGAALVVLVGWVLLLPVGDGLARLSYDIPFVWTPWLDRNIPPELVMVYLDPRIKTNLGQPADEPLDRHFYTQLLERLTADGARLVFFDILFDSPHANPAVDANFADAIRRHGRVVLVGYRVNQFQGNVAVTAVMPPVPSLANAAAGWGLAEISPDPADQCVRVLDAGSEDFPSAGWVAASVLNAAVTRQPETRLDRRWLNYYCSPLLVRAVNLDEALQQDGLTNGYFRDKIVIVGSRPRGGGVAGAGREEFKTPFSRLDTASGPTIHAFSLLNLQRGDWLNRLGSGKESALVVIWGILISFMLLRLRPWPATLLAPVIFCALAFLATDLQMRHHLWFAWLVPAGAQTSVALIWSVGFQYLFESRRRRRLRRAFAAYLSPHMADRIAESGFDLAPGGKEVEATILFTDLEGFTRMSETLPPSEISRILISYFNETTRAILDRKGTIIKYMGDAVMAAWGAPLADPRHAQQAVLAALGMREAGRKDISGRRLRTRFGINSGLVLAGNLGSEFRFDYTLIGETTNLASRLERLNKRFRTDILITESTRRELDGEILVRYLGGFILVGSTRVTRVYEVLGLTSDFPSSPPWLDAFGRALEHFAKREFDDAEGLLRKVFAQREGGDGAAEFYLNEIARARAVPATEVTWDGSIRLDSK